VSSNLTLVVGPKGVVRSLYHDALDLTALGRRTIVRASHIEPDANGCWWADLAPVAGPTLGPFVLRAVALAAEAAWLENHRLGSQA